MIKSMMYVVCVIQSAGTVQGVGVANIQERNEPVASNLQWPLRSQIRRPKPWVSTGILQQILVEAEVRVGSLAKLLGRGQFGHKSSEPSREKWQRRPTGRHVLFEDSEASIQKSAKQSQSRSYDVPRTTSDNT